MKKYFLLYLALVSFIKLSAQDFTGQWKGSFTDKSAGSVFGARCDYVLELECKGNSVTGSSYTYSSEGGKNYYSICSVAGFIDRKQKYIEIKETERTKTNWPDIFSNCFQVHKLTYFKTGETSTLEGNWEPAPGQGKCGFGSTVLTRRELKQSFPNFNSKASKSSPQKKENAAKVDPKSPVKKTNPPFAKKAAPANKHVIKPTNPVAVNKIPPTSQPKTNSLKKADIAADSMMLLQKESPGNILAPPVKFEKRDNTVLKTIQVENKTVKVDLYDNGEVDGDSISLFYNGKLLLSGKRLSEKPISLSIDVENDIINELVMYAENLGTIPPNTALMVVTDGSKRYEVRITSDLQKSGVINFVHKSSLIN